ncbi:hypothetical protein ACN28E_04370 [Archangium lansingense]|uniref:hypothetical protein n=1 Tax=Archangium lansingense TaxID=2995310 RepID=UPI003B823BB0
MLRKSLVTSFLALGLTFAPTIAAAGEGAECVQGKLTLQTVVDKHLKAVGGKERLKAVKTLHLTTLVREGDTVTTSTVQRARPNLVRYDMDKNGTRVSKLFDGQQGWVVEGSAAPQRLDKEKSATMAEGAFFEHDALLDPKARGVALKLDGVEEVHGAPAFKLVLTRGTTTEVRFIDQSSFLEVRRTYAGTHEGKAYNKAITFSDYRDVDGIMLSHRTQWEADGKQGEKVIQSARYDAPIDATVFKPATPRS